MSRDEIKNNHEIITTIMISQKVINNLASIIVAYVYVCVHMKIKNLIIK